MLPKGRKGIALMIVHPGSRTRALYLWESDDLRRRQGVRQIDTYEAYSLPARFMLWNGGVRGVHKIPHVRIRNLKGDPACYGRTLIVLTYKDHLNITLVHELVHALGYGSDRNPHSRGFILRYIDALVWCFNWDADELRLQAHQWRLI